MEPSPLCSFGSRISAWRQKTHCSCGTNSAPLSATEVNQLVARISVGFLNLLQYPREVIGLRSLQGRELFIREQVPQPQLLTNRQHVPVVDESGARSSEC